MYRRIDVTGRSRVPKSRPAILAANHSNALGDVAVIVAKMPKFPQFLAAASWWRWAPVRWLFRFGGVVPIHRRREGETEQNASTFDACHSALRHGAHLAIFPEGEMHLEPALLPLKTGVARIALGAASEAHVAGIVIVPVGLVYDHRGRWRSDVEVHIGEPIEVDEWTELNGIDPAKAVRAVTDLLTDRLAEAMVNQGSRAESVVIDRAAALALAEVPRRGSKHAYAHRNQLRRALASSVANAGGEASQEYCELRDAVGAHVEDLLAMGCGGASEAPSLTPARREERDRLRAELAGLAVPALVGLLANAPTLGVVGLATGRVRNEGWKATTLGVGGTFLSPIVWAVEYVALTRLLGRRSRALALVVAGAAGGIAALAWRERWQRRQQIRWLDDISANEPALLVRAEASRAALNDRVASLIGAGSVVAAP